MGKILFLCFLPCAYPDPVPDPADALPIIVKSINKVLVKHYVTNYEIVKHKNNHWQILYRCIGEKRFWLYISALSGSFFTFIIFAI